MSVTDGIGGVTSYERTSGSGFLKSISDPLGRKKYRDFVKGMIKEKDAMKGEMNKRVVYGSEDFIKGVAKEYKVEAVIKPKGRPKKDENKINRTVPFSGGALWEKVRKVTENALKIGALLPVPTVYEFIEDSGIRFFVRILSNLSRKDKAGKEQKKEAEAGKKVNPFLPYDKDLFVADVSETHVAVLNKYNVVDKHLLIITREFEDQETLLTMNDFEALFICLSEYNSLGFYNGGEAAGASQAHKHLQMVPLPLAPEKPDIPIEPLLAHIEFHDGFGAVKGFPFRHIFSGFDQGLIESPPKAGRKAFNLYSKMLRKLGMRCPEKYGPVMQSMPYCLLVTWKWMLLVPRTKEFFEGISFNSLGFAGALLVRSKEQMELLKKTGPMNALKNVAIPL